MTNWTPERIRSIADRMAMKLGREVRVSPATLPLIITALRQYADDLVVAASLARTEYQVREWDERDSLVRELAVCRDLTAAIGALEAVASDRPEARLTMGQKARILRSRGPGSAASRLEGKMLARPRPEGQRE